MKTRRNPDDVHPPAAHYVHQIEISAPQRLLTISGQIGMRRDGSVPDDPLEQLDEALENVFRNLRAAAMEPADLLKLTFYHVGAIDTARRRALVAEKLRDHKPCMTVLFVAALGAPEMKVEIDAVASRAAD